MTGSPSAPGITDHLPLSIRAYAASEAKGRAAQQYKRAKRERRLPPASEWALVFDTETTTDAGQALRFGTYQVYKGGELYEAGIFYADVTADELAVLHAHAIAHGLRIITRDVFADEIFYGIGYKLRATIVGFNLPFDISRIAIDHDSARREMRGGFTFRISATDKWLPHVRVRHISQRASFIGFAGSMQQRQGRSDRKHGRKFPVRRGYFIDVKTLAGALFAQSFSLASLSAFLGIPNPKLDFDEFAGPITDEMVGYAVRDVQATWECYAELVERYAKLGLSGTPPEKIYSEASIGKGYLRAMGIRPWRECQPDFPPQMLGNILNAYYGGRSEVRIRRELRQVQLCDFLSMYPTVCTLMGLWRFVIADGMAWRDATAETRALLDRIDIDMLKSKTIWQQFPVLVRVKPDADIFPVRAHYGQSPQATIGANFLTADRGLWFTLPDCIASKLLTGKAPEILKAIVFSPGPAQPDLRPVQISGKTDYTVDPVADDFYRRIIELRQTVKARRDDGNGDTAALDTEQNALKIAANATSYGVFVEVNVEGQASKVPIAVHTSTCDPFSVRSPKVEVPGPYFHPLLATLITGAARLMLAITERLVSDHDLEWAFCDTDSMAIAKPDAMDDAEFRERVRRIVDWFAGLNPYSFGGSILKIEDVNFSIAKGNIPEPLYCWAVSAKRYALFNLDSEGRPVLRKASAHGLGHLYPPYGDDDPAPGMPAPQVPLSKIGAGFKLWQHDLWWQIISAALRGTPEQVNHGYHPALERPAASRYGATTPALLSWFKTFNADRPYRDQVKPFGFLLSLGASRLNLSERILDELTPRRRKKVKSSKPIAPFDRDIAAAAQSAFDRETREAISPEALRTYRQMLAQYHLQPEAKFLNGEHSARGTTLRRHVRMTMACHIGKESNDWERQAFLGLDEDTAIEYQTIDRDVLGDLRTFTAKAGITRAAKMLGTTVHRLRIMIAGGTSGDAQKRLRDISAQLPFATEQFDRQESDRQTQLSEWRQRVSQDGLRQMARRLGVDPSNFRRLLS